MKKGVKIILLNQKKEILLQLRDNKPHIAYPGYWDLIGGELEEKESDIEGIKREIREEIEIETEKTEKVGEVYFKKDNLNKENWNVSIFKGHVYVLLKNIKLNEGQKLKFFKLNNLQNIRFPQCYREFIFKNKDKILG